MKIGFQKMNIKEIVEDLVDTFLKAGEMSLSLREKGLKKEIKSDNTPVSNGDLEVNKFITNKIFEITPNIPIISEENSENKNNSNLRDFWLVDTIDGTYRYINGLEEFTIHDGFIINTKPVAGLINDVVTGLPIGISSFNYLLICGFAAYLRTITLRPNLVKDWFFFLFTILLVNSLSYSILNIFFSIDLNYYNLFVNIFFTFIFYIIFANLFLMYQNKFFKEGND